MDTTEKDKEATAASPQLRFARSLNPQIFRVRGGSIHERFETHWQRLEGREIERQALHGSLNMRQRRQTKRPQQAQLLQRSCISLNCPKLARIAFRYLMAQLISTRPALLYARH